MIRFPARLMVWAVFFQLVEKISAQMAGFAYLALEKGPTRYESFL